MIAVEELLNRIREIAIQKTRERLGRQKRDVNVLMLTILSEIYSLEYLISELLKTLDELSSQAWKNKFNPHQATKNEDKR